MEFPFPSSMRKKIVSNERKMTLLSTNIVMKKLKIKLENGNIMQ